jgi:Flp pilus assembly protein TadD
MEPHRQANAFVPGRAGKRVAAPTPATAPSAPSPDPYEQARELLAAGEVEEARTVYSHLLSADPRDMRAREGIAACATAAGNSALRDGDVNRAVSHFQKALEIVPFHPGADDGLRRAAALAKA